jgi:hypothetical protein
VKVNLDYPRHTATRKLMMVIEPTSKEIIRVKVQSRECKWATPNC